jgi:hypothetical protein
LASGASSGDLVQTVSFYVSSVLNAIPAVAGAVTDTYLNTGAVTTAKIADANVTTVKIADANITPAKISTGGPSWTSGGDLSFNSGYGSVATAYGCRAWVNFNGTGTISIRSSGGVTSISDDGTGSYTMNFSFTMPDINYCATGVSGIIPGISEAIIVPNFTPPSTETASTTTTFKFATIRPNVTSAADANYVYLTIFR